jgi:hypothetical protein
VALRDSGDEAAAVPEVGVMNDSNLQPPLHPERIRKTLKTIGAEQQCTLLPEELETCQAALELIRKSQLALGLNSHVVDRVIQAKELAASGLDFLGQIRDLMGKK